MSPIPPNSTVLVTGANGFLASHVVDQLLIAGHKVRGTVRAPEKGQWLVDHFGKTYGPGVFELAIVPDMSKDNAFDAAMTGCTAVVHVASDVSFSPNPEDVIPGVERAIASILHSAVKSGGIKRFVLTSSSSAAVYPVLGKVFTVKKDSWNEYSVKQAWSKDEEGKAGRGYHVYCASKVAGERALWKFLKEQKPAFDINAVLPNMVTGKVIGRKWGQAGSSGGAIVDLYTETGDKLKAACEFLEMIPPQWMVDVVDTALLHVAALTDPDVVGERVFAFSQPYNNNEILAALRKLRPNHKFPEKFSNDGHDLSIIEPRERAEEILRKNYGRGFRSLEESVAESIAGL